MSKLDAFTEFVKASCSPGSNLPGSYMRALRYVTKFLNAYVPQYASLPPVWDIDSLDVIEELYAFVKAEEKKGETSAFYRSDLPKSYLKHRYCTNALKTFGRFLSSAKMEDEAISIYKSTNEAESVARGIAKIRILKPNLFFDRHLISFDEDYRMILAPSLKEYFTNDAFVRVFKDLEGRRITKALRFQPSQEFLQRHREQMI